jgi:hypothetical protein
MSATEAISGAPSELFVLRAPVPTDEAWIFSSWLKCLQLDSKSSQHMRRRTFFTRHHQVIEAIFRRPDVCVTIAAPRGDQLTILGYCVSEPRHGVLHWVHVKDGFRRFGIATTLITSALGASREVRYSHRTHTIEPILRQLEIDRAWQELECQRCDRQLQKTDVRPDQPRLDCPQCKWSSTQPPETVRPRPRFTYDPYLQFLQDTDTPERKTAPWQT